MTNEESGIRAQNGLLAWGCLDRWTKMVRAEEARPNSSSLIKGWCCTLKEIDEPPSASASFLDLLSFQ